MSGWIVRCANSHPHAALGRTRARTPVLTRRTGCCAQAESGVEQKWTACREACTADTVPADKYAEASICLITVLQPNPNPSPSPSPIPSPSPDPKHAEASICLIAML